MGGSQGKSTSLPPLATSLCSPQAIQTYLEQTGNNYRCPDLQHVWKVDREGEVREI